MVEKGDSVSWTLDITESIEGSNSSSYKTPSPSLRRYHESNGTLVSRQGSLRLPMTRWANLAPSRTRSNSVSVAESTRAAVSTGAEETVWNPSYNSTPLQRRRNNVAAGDKLWVSFCYRLFNFYFVQAQFQHSIFTLYICVRYFIIFTTLSFYFKAFNFIVIVNIDILVFSLRTCNEICFT
jgi:hypothetical protein